MKLLSYIKKNYSKSLLILISGNSLIYILPIFTAPILSRLYTPLDYGIIAYFTIIIGLFETFVSSHFTHVIIVSRRKKDIVGGGLISMAISILVSLAIFVCTLFLSNEFKSYITSYQYSYFVYYIPISILFSGINSVLYSWNNKAGHFKLITATRVTQSIISALIAITIGMHIQGPLGLFYSMIFSSLFPVIIQIIYFLKNDKKLLSLISIHYAKNVFRKNITYLTYTFPSDLISNYSGLIPNFIIEKFGGKNILGAYQFSNRILGIPINLAGNAILEVFRKSATDEYNKKGNCAAVFKKNLNGLCLVSTGPTLILLFLGPKIFSFVFGSNWEIAGEIAQILSILFFFKTIVGPLSYMYYIANKQKEDFYTQLIKFLFNVSALCISYLVYRDIFIMLKLYICTSSIFYLFQLYRSYVFSKGK